jgi:hypothetical protein
MVAGVVQTYRAIANSEYPEVLSTADSPRVLTSEVERETTQTAS